MTHLHMRWQRFAHQHQEVVPYLAGAIVANIGWLAFYLIGGAA